jgi:CBS domain-containing protein
MEPVESPVRIGDVDRVDAVTGPVRGWIAAIDDPTAVDGYATEVAAVAGVLMRGRAGALATCRALTSLHDALTVRLIQLAAVECGPPPCEYAWLALGSGGRMEQSLDTDQDNAIAYAEQGEAAEVYFATLGARVVAGLARAGLRRCPGGYMADRWHLPLAGWHGVFGGWVDRPVPQALVEAEVFLDFRPVYGGLSMATLDAALRRGCGVPRFLVGMARAAVGFPPPLGLAGRVRSRRGEVDLKRGGLAAVVLLARLYALAAGSSARSTPGRLAAAEAAGTLSRSSAAALADAYRILSDLRLDAQLRQLAAGGEPTNRTRLGDLGADQRARLRGALCTVRDLQRVAAMRFRTDTVL